MNLYVNVSGEHHMSPVEIRETSTETMLAFLRSWGHTQRVNVRILVAALRTYPWLNDQIPCDVLGIVRRVAAEV